MISNRATRAAINQAAQVLTAAAQVAADRAEVRGATVGAATGVQVVHRTRAMQVAPVEAVAAVVDAELM